MTIAALIPELQPFASNLIEEAGRAGLRPQITSTRRSFSEQGRLYKKYVSGQSQYPAAAPGTSAHEYGWAFDMIVTPIGALKDVGHLWESWGGVWGGRFHDPVHFEFPGFQAPPNPRTDAFLRAIFRAADLASYVVTPLGVEEHRPAAYGGFAEGIERLFGR